MKILPSEQLTFRTNLSKTEIIQKISENVALVPKQVFGLRKKDFSKVFEGTIEKDGFKISRTINYRNSFLPLIHGQIAEKNTHSEVKVQMTLQPFVKIFISFWLGAVALGLLAILIASVSENKFEPAFAIPLLMLAGGFALTHLAFRYEYKKSRLELKKLFGAAIS